MAACRRTVHGSPPAASVVLGRLWRSSEQQVHRTHMAACGRTVHGGLPTSGNGSRCMRCSSKQPLQGCGVAVLGC